MFKPLVLLPLLLAAAPALSQSLSPDEAALKAHVAFLADDSLKGRDTGSPEFDTAAHYVASRMLAAGLVPGGDDGGWFQKVPLVGTRPDGKGTMTLTRGGAQTALAFGQDFITGINPLVPDFSASGEVVFAGYGVIDKTSGRDDYKGLDVRGKVVAILYGGPADLPSEVRAHYGSREVKAEIAAAHGAKGLIFIESTMLHTVYPFHIIAASWEEPGMRWAEPDGKPHVAAGGLPGLGILSQAGAAKLFAGSRFKWDAVLAADAAGKKVPTGDLGVTVSMHQAGKIWAVPSVNVVGLLEGSDPGLKAETVILSAHLDHIGISAPDARGDTINNGAMDNAVGVASMLEVARAFQASGKRPRRSILFIALTAEEKGLIGSDYFARHPTSSAGTIVANVNLDMPILTYKFEDLVVYGADRTSIGPIVARVAGAEGVALTPDPAPEQASFVRSDHYSFVRTGVPAVSIEPGPKGPGKAAIEDFLEHHYHQPSDEVTLPIDWGQGVRFVKLNYEIARALADGDARASWNKGDFFGVLFGGYGAK